MKDKENFLLSLSITLGVILLGLISYVVYSEYRIQNRTLNRCPYQGWSYEHGESFDSGDGCNVCVCNDGVIACTERACDINLEDNLDGE
ncbi:MAG: hypothetical protein PHG60_02465 [Candidatus Dojkabacteria bacterium]|jgi:hypothetical protein|nr:hypothetical protein [Candidatus Dojkabacteria bacterium]